jgi:hypothetical protein
MKKNGFTSQNKLQETTTPANILAAYSLLSAQFCYIIINTRYLGSQSQSRSYFTTGGLLPISSSWRQAPWGTRPQILFICNWTLASLSPCNSLSNGRMGCLLWISFAFFNFAYCTYSMLLTILPWHSIQVFCQFRFCRAVHDFLTYVMLQRQLSYLNGRNLDRRQVSTWKVSISVRVRVTLRLTVYRNKFNLATSPFRLTTSNFIFQLNICCYSPYVKSSLTKGWVCRLQLLLALASTVILRSESCGIHDHILLSQIRDFLNLGGQFLVFISARNRVTQLCPLALGSLFVSYYDS